MKKKKKKKEKTLDTKAKESFFRINTWNVHDENKIITLTRVTLFFFYAKQKKKNEQIYQSARIKRQKPIGNGIKFIPGIEREKYLLKKKKNK